MPNWKKVITSGSDAILNQITSSGGIDSPDITIDDWGSVSASLASLDTLSNPTLQNVTDNGSTTTNTISVPAVTINSTGSDFLRLGFEAGYSNPNNTWPGNGGVIIGTQALKDYSGNLDSITIVGDYVASNATSIGDGVTLIGHNIAPNSYTKIGERTTAIGFQAMAGGFAQGGRYNTMIGSNALFNYAGGDDLIAIGYLSGPQVVTYTGSGDFYIGRNSGEKYNAYFVPPKDSIYFGNYTKSTFAANLGSQTENEIVIGHYVSGSGTNTVTIGNSSITNNYFSGDISGSDVTIDDWGSVSASLADINSISASIATDIASIQGSGYVDTTGTPSNNQLAIFTDSNTIEGVNNLTYDNTTFNVSGSKFVVDAKFDPSSAVSLGMGGTEYLTIDSANGLQTFGGFTSTGPIGVNAGAGQSFGANGLDINNAANANVDATIRLAASSSGASGPEAYWTFGIKATDNSHDFVFTNYSVISGVGVPDPAFTISKATNQVKIGSLVVSGSGTFKNIGPAQFSGSVSITTADQVAATVDTDKFLVIDGQQIKYRSGTQILSDIDGVSTNTTQTITGIKTFSSDTTFNGDVIVGGRITAQEFNTEFVSSSIIFSSGSTKFGDSSDDTHDFTGSINVDGGITIWNTGDPKLTFQTQGGANDYSVGIDDSDSDKFKISRSSTLGTNDIYKYNYNSGTPNHTLNGDLVLTNSSVGLAANTILKTNGSGFVVPAVAGTDYVATGSIKPKLGVNNVADFKSLTAGYASLTAVTDVQVNDDSPYTFWMAPNAGYIEKVVVIVGGANGTTDNFTIQPYKNASTMGSSVANNIGAKGNVDTFTFGASYNFVAEDKIQLYVDRSNNTSALYTINVFFTLT